VDEKREMGDEDEEENDVADYQRIWDTRGATCLIGFEKPHIGVITHWIGDGKLTRTLNSVKSLFLMMISPIPSHLSLSCPHFYHHLRT
jgi:hypothetical protein